MSTVSTNSVETPQVDVRGPRFVAWVTTAILVVVILVSTVSVLAAAIILGLQTLVFAFGAAAGPAAHPYGRVFAALVAPRLSPTREKEPTTPLRFAQGLGFVFALFGTLGFALSAPLVGTVATGLALFAAVLNAAFGICLGCKIYPLARRVLSS
ncbi:MAG: DUF4395 domain-containing protein [Rhodococcus sp. (in: high G+C Gram-positive bacteria)]